jgi:hypothetical protein
MAPFNLTSISTSNPFKFGYWVRELQTLVSQVQDQIESATNNVKATHDFQVTPD